jgi:hypothetical protein
MQMDYSTLFSSRAHQYTYAVKTYPHVLQQEFETAVAMLELKENEHLVNVPAACICIEQYIPVSIQYSMYETSKVFAEINDIPYCTWDTIPWNPQSCDKILCLASLHHATQKERDALYQSAYTALRPGGALVIGDVAKGSKQDSWLNEFVNRYNPAGHCGLFWSEEDAEAMQNAGFTVACRRTSYTWNHRNKEELLDFCKNLFGLDKATEDQIYEGLVQHKLLVGMNMEWKLLYFVAQKPL